MRYVVLGTSEFTLRCAEGLLEGGAAVTALVSMPSHALPLNSVDVASFAANRKIPYHEVEDVNSAEGVRLLAMHEPDYVFSSWPRILGPDVLALPRLFCIGTHPTELPRGRGRHPLHWLIVLGAEGSKLSFFRMVKGVDAGPILLQVDFGLGASHTVAQVGRSVSEAGYRGARLLAERLQDDPVFEGTPQDDRLAIYWRTRTPHDVTLDPRMSASQISRIVRSFAPPYPGAKLIYEGLVLRVDAAVLVEPDLPAESVRCLEPGRVLRAEGDVIRMKVDDGIVDLTIRGEVPKRVRGARYIEPPTRYWSQWARELAAELR